MRQALFPAAALALGIAWPALTQAADERIIKYYNETCGICHGEKGEGTPNLAPPLKGNPFVTGSPPSEIAAVITKGREGAAKRYKELVSPMPAQSMSSSRLEGLVDYVKKDLQK